MKKIILLMAGLCLYGMIVMAQQTQAEIDKVVQNPVAPLPNHFIPVWTGNAYFPMSIGVTQAMVDLVNLAAGDEIGVFDGIYCVGACKLTAPINPVNPPFITASKDDPGTIGIDGYTSGHSIIYKIWKQSANLEALSVIHTFPYAPLFVFETFTQSETAVIMLSGSIVPATRILQNVTISNGQVRCYNASQTITVAGSGTTFLLQSGGSATMIAGQKISYLPGTTIQPGGYLWGYIAPTGPYCVNPSMPATVTGEAEIPTSAELSLFRIYPNPTSGDFILELKGIVPGEDIRVNISGMQGENVLNETINGNQKHTISLTDRKSGIYFIRVISGNNIETMKLIKL